MTRHHRSRAQGRRAPAALAFVAGLAVTGVAAGADTPVEHGRYLATIAACVSCHTPRAPGAAPLSGGTKLGSGARTAVSANITPDNDTGIGAWSEAQIVTALHEGRRPDGSRIGPPMPQLAYTKLTDADAAAIAVYLKSVPPVHNVVERTPRPAEAGAPNDRAGTATPARSNLPRGRYLFEAVAHCAECHAGPGDDAGNAAPRSFGGPHGPVVAPALTPGLVASLSDTDLAHVVMQGQRPDGTRLVGPMPVAAYAHLTPDDLAALIGYLRDPTR